MGKIRVYELAKELGLANKDLVLKLQAMGYPVKSHSSTLEEFLLKEIRERLKGGVVQETASKRPTVIRRRKKVVTPSPDDMIEVEMQPPGPIPARTAPEPGEAAEEVLVVEPAAPVEDEPAAPETTAEAAPEETREPEITAAEAATEEAAEETTEAPPAVEAEPAPPGEPVAVEEETTEQESEYEAEAAEEEEEEETPSSQPKSAKAPRIKRIEKTTAEPAKIISRPVAPPEPPAKPPKRTKPEQMPIPEPKIELPEAALPPVRGVDKTPPAEPIEPPSQETRKGKKKKKAKDSGDASRKPGAQRRKEVIERNDLYDAPGWDRSSRSGRRAARTQKKIKKTEITVPKQIKRRIKVADAISVAELAKKMGIKAGDIIKKLMGMGLMANLNQAVDFDTSSLVAAEFGYEVEQGAFDEKDFIEWEEDQDVDKALRPPVVTVMGHVDHGKTSLLDAIRQTDVIGGEAGGITQHIGAYFVETPSGPITFLDTPGHAAFTSMRARGAQITDIVILVVAADDGVMQQTREAADHARAAGVPIIVAVNKVDKPEADPDKIKREIADLGLVPEAWGGDTITVDVSAKTGQGLDELMEMILLQSEVMELRAAPDGRATGHIVEARLDKGRGPVATVLIESGKIRQGDPYVCGVYHGKVRAMFNDKGQRIDEAGPSVPVEIQGISGVPQAGDEFIVVEDEKKAKQVSSHRQLKLRENELLKTSKVTLETLFDSIRDGIKELNLVLKADVQGSLEAIADALTKLNTEEVKIHIIHSSTGAITETDIMLASASNALIIGFNVRPNAKVQELAEAENIQIRFYDIIYKLIDEIKEAMAGMLEPIQEERTLGRAEVRQAFHVSKVGTIAGCAVTDGKILRGSKARLLRDDVVVYDGRIVSLKRFKEDAREVLTGYECGIGLDNYNDIKSGDVIEAYMIEEVTATLD